MRRHPTVGLSSAVILLAAAACATVPAAGSGGPTDAPLPPGTYQLTSYVTYRNDSNVARVESHTTYTTRLFVSPDGTTKLYEDNRPCTLYADLPQDMKEGRRQPGPGRNFVCGDRTWHTDWTVWANGNAISGRMSVRVTETVQAGKKCLVLDYSSGRPVCHQWGPEVSTRSRLVTTSITVQKAGG